MTLPNDPTELSKIWLPRVRFEISSELKSNEFLRFLHSLIVEFVRKIEPGRAEWNEWNSFKFGNENGGEGGMGGFYVRGVYFKHCKMYGYDGTRTGQNYAGWKGFMIRNHDEQRCNTPILYEVANLLEELFKERKVYYERFGVKAEEHVETFQSQFPSNK